MQINSKKINITRTHLIIAFLAVVQASPPAFLFSQKTGLVNTSKSKYAMLSPVGIDEVSWRDGFWANWYATCRDVMVPQMMKNYMDDDLSHGYKNFEIAAGLKEGRHKGPPYQDGNFYKILEAMIMVNAIEKDPETDYMLDSIISVIGSTQRADGYIHTQVMIEQKNHDKAAKEFRKRMDFETYNMGHLMTAACLHYRSTEKENLLNIAIGAANFLYDFYSRNPEELAENAICPSHYMGVTEIYRTTGDPRYLELAKGLIDIRSKVKEGTDHNQDRIPFREQTKAVGQAVRANYLYAGAADVFAETGDQSLYQALDAIWNDLREHKLYITGACGALYDGVSPKGTTYKQLTIQQVHQAYGQDYELPNLDAHNESCANIGNLLWNWRMFLVTGDARYIDMLEQVAFNSLLSGVSLDGYGYFYTNPLAVSRDISHTLRWSKVREPYLSRCNCCPPNTIRTISEIHNYFYSLSDKGLWINLYGANSLKTVIGDDGVLELVQETDYPWEGRVRLQILKAPRGELSVFLRIPGWSTKHTIMINGVEHKSPVEAGSYSRLSRKWKRGDEIVLDLEMEPFLVESHPLVEENRNMIAVKRGPVVYCLETADIPKGIHLSDVLIPVRAKIEPKMMNIGNSRMVSLEVEAMVKTGRNWDHALYKPLQDKDLQKLNIKLIPYYAWGNRGEGDMEVWIPLAWQ